MSDRTLGTDPNVLHTISLVDIAPNPENCRLFVERQSLAALEARYRQWLADPTTVLPDAPILQLRPQVTGSPRFVLLAGERRVTAARAAGVSALPCRVTLMSDEDAYRFLLAHNDTAGLTTAERAFRAAEMVRLGFSTDEISKDLGGVAAHRYITVGNLIRPEWFTDDRKLCDPSIIEWYEAALFGDAHFKVCFTAWNAGLWDAKRCSREFRRRGQSSPMDNAEKGFRLTRNRQKLVLRGQLDLTQTDRATADSILDALIGALEEASLDLREEDFGRSIQYFNAETVAPLGD